MLLKIYHTLMLGNFVVFSFLRSEKLTRFLTTCTIQYNFIQLIWTFSAFLHVYL